MRSFLVYRCMCSKCNVTYYGKTCRQAFTRAAEHMGVSNLTGKRLFLHIKRDDSVFRKTTKPFPLELRD